MADASELDWEALAREIRKKQIPGLCVPADTTDNQLSHLGDLRNLVKLDLKNTRLSDRGLSYLQNLKGLCKLNLASTKVTNEGLPNLEGISDLHKLNLRHTAATYSGVKKLNMVIPGVSVRY